MPAIQATSGSVTHTSQSQQFLPSAMPQQLAYAAPMQQLQHHGTKRAPSDAGFAQQPNSKDRSHLSPFSASPMANSAAPAQLHDDLLDPALQQTAYAGQPDGITDDDLSIESAAYRLYRQFDNSENPLSEEEWAAIFGTDEGVYDGLALQSEHDQQSGFGMSGLSQDSSGSVDALLDNVGEEGEQGLKWPDQSDFTGALASLASNNGGDP